MAHVDRLRPDRRRARRLIPFALALAAVACGGDADTSAPPAAEPTGPQPEATSLLGEPLFPPPLSDEARTDREAKLAVAEAAYEADPYDLEAIVWYGRRTAYLGRYQDAIGIYTTGLDHHAGDPELLRHRGHRHVSIRELDAAIADLEQAAAAVAGQPDRVEPDGLPNARNTPTSTLQTNIWYHLGLAYYLKGDFENAARCYAECMAVSKNPDMVVATAHWQYMTLRRLGRDTEAAAVLEPISADMDIIENEGYHQLLLMYRGELSPEDVLPDGDSIESATAAYGVANWHAYNGRPDEAQALLERIVAGSQWSAFGYIAAEADLAR